MWPSHKALCTSECECESRPYLETLGPRVSDNGCQIYPLNVPKHVQESSGSCVDIHDCMYYVSFSCTLTWPQGMWVPIVCVCSHLWPWSIEDSWRRGLIIANLITFINGLARQTATIYKLYALLRWFASIVSNACIHMNWKPIHEVRG